jgi:hypothetical protein
MGFWHTFFLLFLFIPLTILWFVCMFDLIFRQTDISGWRRAAWAAFIIFFPVIGALAYLAVHGSGSESVGAASGARDDALRMTGRTP